MRRICQVKILEQTYDLAKNGSACLAIEKKDIYDRPYAETIMIDNLLHHDVLQALLDLLADSREALEAAHIALQREADRESK